MFLKDNVMKKKVGSYIQYSLIASNTMLGDLIVVYVSTMSSGKLKDKWTKLTSKGLRWIQK